MFAEMILMEWGRIKLATKQKTPGTVTISSIKNTTQTEELERLDPNQAERVLGIRLPLTGAMKDELKFRRKQLTEFSLRLYKSPLTHKEAHNAYQTRYRTIATYPYPVMIFTTKELEAIQRKAIYLMLPKLGINRHMPRAVIYGPRKIGGRQLMDLTIEQPTKNFETTVGHLRRSDGVADALIATLHDLQIETGRETEFFQLDPSQHQYVTKSTRWRYLWEMAWEFQIDVRIFDHWVPKSEFVNDKNIMAIAINGRYYQGKNKYKLETINQCRLFQQAFYIGDLAVEDSLTVNKGYLDGSIQHRHKDLKFPEMLKPTKL